MNKGWIKIDRSIINHWIFQNDRFFKWWILVLIEVNHRDNNVLVGYGIVNVKRGQSVKSLRSWASLFKCDTKQVVKFFNLLEKDDMIKRSKVGKMKQSTTLVNITNYEQYQGVNETQSPTEIPTQLPTQSPTQEPHNRGTNKKVKNVNNENNVKNKEERANEFATSVNQFSDYDSKMLINFISYWTESSEKQKKLRFEFEKVFDFKRRLATWKSRDKGFSKNDDDKTGRYIKSSIVDFVYDPEAGE